MINRSRRTKPIMAKAGVTRNPKRRYSCGDKGNYTLYVCRIKHNKGTYTFAIS